MTFRSYSSCELVTMTTTTTTTYAKNSLPSLSLFLGLALRLNSVRSAMCMHILFVLCVYRVLFELFLFRFAVYFVRMFQAHTRLPEPNVCLFSVASRPLVSFFSSLFCFSRASPFASSAQQAIRSSRDNGVRHSVGPATAQSMAFRVRLCRLGRFSFFIR